MRNKLPKGWISAELSDILEAFESGGRPKGGVKNIKHGIPSIGGEHLNSSGGFNFTKIKYIPENFYKTMSIGRIKKGDILIVKDGATTGKTSIVRENFPYRYAAVNEHVFIARPFSEISNLYLFYYIFSFYGQDYVRRNFKGTAQGGINLAFAKNTFIPLPPLPEQHRIVAKIEELFTKLDAGVEALKKIKKQIKQYRQAVLKYAFEGKLTEEWRLANAGKLEPANVLLEKMKKERKKQQGKKYKELLPVDKSDLPELPEGWVWTKIGEIYDIVGGGTPSTKIKEYWEGDTPWITSADIHGLKDIRPRRKITRKAIANSATNLVPRNSLIVVTRVGLGKVALTKNPICFSQDSQALIGNSTYIYHDYSLYYLSKAVQIFKYKHRGTTIEGVTKKQLYELTFPLPSILEQHKIVEEIERRFSVADNIEKIVDENLKQAERLRQSILKKAFEGKLVPQDPNDEPASVLLQKIKAEKKKLEEEKKVSKKKKKKGEIGVQ